MTRYQRVQTARSTNPAVVRGLGSGDTLNVIESRTVRPLPRVLQKERRKMAGGIATRSHTNEQTIHRLVTDVIELLMSLPFLKSPAGQPMMSSHIEAGVTMRSGLHAQSFVKYRKRLPRSRRALVVRSAASMWVFLLQRRKPVPADGGTGHRPSGSQLQAWLRVHHRTPWRDSLRGDQSVSRRRHSSCISLRFGPYFSIPYRAGAHAYCNISHGHLCSVKTCLCCLGRSLGYAFRKCALVDGCRAPSSDLL